jgi:hypothetical protein
LKFQKAVSSKTVGQELHKSNIYGRAAIAKPLITENNTERLKRWFYDHKTWVSGDWKYVIWSDESSFTLFPISLWVFVWRTLKVACDDWGSNTLVFHWSSEFYYQ